MMALSIRQPWAAAIVLGLKDVENRGWSVNYRGPFLVHAGKTQDFQAGYVERIIEEHVDEGRVHEEVARAACSPGCIVGVVKIADCVQDHSSFWAADGQNHWVLEEARAFFKPVRCRGQRGFWTPQEHVLFNVRRQLAERGCT